MVKFLTSLGLALAVTANTAMAMPKIMTPNELHQGMLGYAETTTTGNQRTKFNIEIIGVVPSGKGEPPQILARAYGGIIPDTHGVIHGMSGSPVFVEGKLIGAVARGIGEDVLPYKFYITPINAMEKIWTMPDEIKTNNVPGYPRVHILTPEEYDKRETNRHDDLLKEVERYKSPEWSTPEGKTPVIGDMGKKLFEILDNYKGTETQPEAKDTKSAQEAKTAKTEDKSVADTTIDKAKSASTKKTVAGTDSVTVAKQANDTVKASEDSATTTAAVSTDKDKQAKESSQMEQTPDKPKSAVASSKPTEDTNSVESVKEADDKQLTDDAGKQNNQPIVAKAEVAKDENKKSGNNKNASETVAVEHETVNQQATIEHDSSKDVSPAKHKATKADKADKADEGKPKLADTLILPLDLPSSREITSADEQAKSKTVKAKRYIINDLSKPVMIVPAATLWANSDKIERGTSVSWSQYLASKQDYQRQHTPSKFIGGKDHSIFISGFANSGKQFLERHIHAKKLNVYDLLGSDTAETSDFSDIIPDYQLEAGDPIGVTLVYGDFIVGATGTVTARKGDQILAFGHPMLYRGNVNYFMNAAKVIDSAGGILNGVQISSIGKIVGRISQDRYAGIAGVLNEYPASVPVKVTVKDKNLNITRVYGAKVAYNEEAIPILVPSIVYGAMDRTADRQLTGTAKVNFTIDNNISDGGSFERENLFYDPEDLGQAATSELIEALTDLVNNTDKASDIYGVNVNVELTSARKTATIISVGADKSEARPGDVVTFNIVLKPYREEESIITVPYKIPANQAEGPLTFEVKGGGFIRIDELIPEGIMAKNEDEPEESTEDQLQDLQEVDHNNELIISPIVAFHNDKDIDKAIDEAYKFSQHMDSLSKSERDELTHEREAKYTTDYVIDNVRQITIQIKSHLKTRSK